MHLLIVEDDIDLGQALLSALQPEGFTCLWVRRLADAGPLPDQTVDAVVLDVSLPDGNGIGLLRQWRARHAEVPVIVITARSALEDRLAGLDSGADDYLVKPFAMAELVSRLWAVHRRSVRQAAETWTLGELTLQPRAHLAWRRGEPLALSPREYRLLLELARSPGVTVSKSALCERLDPYGDPVHACAVEVHMSNLRRKVGAEHFRTVRGVGYQLVA